MVFANCPGMGVGGWGGMGKGMTGGGECNNNKVNNIIIKIGEIHK